MDIDANKIGSTGQNTGDSSSVKKPKREEVDFKSVFETDYETSFENDDLDNVKAEDIFSKFTDEEYKTLDIDEQVDFLEDPSFNFDISDYDAVEAGEEGNNDSFLRKENDDGSIEYIKVIASESGKLGIVHTTVEDGETVGQTEIYTFDDGKSASEAAAASSNPGSAARSSDQSGASPSTSGTSSNDSSTTTAASGASSTQDDSESENGDSQSGSNSENSSNNSQGKKTTTTTTTTTTNEDGTTTTTTTTTTVYEDGGSVTETVTEEEIDESDNSETADVDNTDEANTSSDTPRTTGADDTEEADTSTNTPRTTGADDTEEADTSTNTPRTTGADDTDEADTSSDTPKTTGADDTEEADTSSDTPRTTGADDTEEADTSSDTPRTTGVDDTDETDTSKTGDVDDVEKADTSEDIDDEEALESDLSTDSETLNKYLEAINTLVTAKSSDNLRTPNDVINMWYNSGTISESDAQILRASFTKYSEVDEKMIQTQLEIAQINNPDVTREEIIMQMTTAGALSNPVTSADKPILTDDEINSYAEKFKDKDNADSIVEMINSGELSSENIVEIVKKVNESGESFAWVFDGKNEVTEAITTALIEQASNGNTTALELLCKELYSATAGRWETADDYLKCLFDKADDSVMSAIVANYNNITSSDLVKDIRNDYQFDIAQGSYYLYKINQAK